LRALFPSAQPALLKQGAGLLAGASCLQQQAFMQQSHEEVREQGTPSAHKRSVASEGIARLKTEINAKRIIAITLWKD
ncbi:MAG: hypothetical protein ACWGN7_07155, partial [Thermodesulfovibrionales bacterium]